MKSDFEFILLWLYKITNSNIGYKPDDIKITLSDKSFRLYINKTSSLIESLDELVSLTRDKKINVIIIKLNDDEFGRILVNYSSLDKLFSENRELIRNYLINKII